MKSGTVALGRGPAILLHGGAWDIPAEETEAHLDGMRQALQAGRQALKEGQPAVDVVVAVIQSMESSGVFDAGSGSVLTRGGLVEMDAGLMRGGDLAYGAVGALRDVANPIAAARHVLEYGRGEAQFIVGRAAEELLHAAGIPVTLPEDLKHPRELARWRELSREAEHHSSHAFLKPRPRGTVGCTVRDARGGVAAGTSTGGTPMRPEGRVGDSPQPGSGYYADRCGACSATGWGEAITAAGLSGRAVGRLEDGGTPEEAVRNEIARMRNRISNPQGQAAAAGLILMPAKGDAAWCYNTPRMARAAWSDSLGVWARLDPRDA